MWVSKYGTKIDLTGLNPAQVKEIQGLANTRYGTKATDLAKKYRTAPTAPTTPTAPAGPSTPAPNTAMSDALSGLAAAGTAPQERTITPENFAAQRAALEKQQYGALTSDFARRQEQQRQQLEQDLYNRGYRPDQTTTTGPGGWDSMHGEFNKNWNDAYLNAAAQASQLGGQEFDRMFRSQEDVIASNQNRESYLGTLANAGLDRASQERLAKLQRDNNLRIAQMQMARRAGGAAPQAATPDKGFDII